MHDMSPCTMYFVVIKYKRPGVTNENTDKANIFTHIFFPLTIKHMN